ncbi:MAG: tRNA (adenosine(37)-N6)-threonylcarbamoyltransferase complex ATPase subunit type 1 TsaE [Thermoleophilia bacterium]
MQVEFISLSEQQTAFIAAQISRLLEPGDTVFLKGQLGTGKTFFVRAAAREMGVVDPVTSPSFTMAQSYSGKVRIHHLDLYRLSSFGSGDMADFEPFFEGDAITFVEWPEQAETFLEEPVLVIELEHLDENSRRMRFICASNQLKEGLEKIFAEAGD